MSFFTPSGRAGRWQRPGRTSSYLVAPCPITRARWPASKREADATPSVGSYGTRDERAELLQMDGRLMAPRKVLFKLSAASGFAGFAVA